MNKKFLSAVLFGALMVTSTGTFVSCKDYDDDIDNLQGQIDQQKGLNEKLSAVETSISSLQTAQTELQKQIAEAKTAAESAALKAQEAAILAAKKDLEAAKAELKKMIEETSSSTVEAINKELAKIQGQIETLLTLNDKVKALETADVALAQSIAELDKQVAENAIAIGKMESALEAQKQALENYQKETGTDVTALQDEVKALQEALDNLSNTEDFSKLAGNVKELQDEVAILSSDIKKINEELDLVWAAIAKGVTHVSLYATPQGIIINGEAQTWAKADIKLLSAKSIADWTFGNGLENAVKFTKGERSKLKASLVVRVSPVTAALSESDIHFISTQLEGTAPIDLTEKGLVKVTGVKPYSGEVLTRSISETGLWTVEIEVGENFDETAFDKATTVVKTEIKEGIIGGNDEAITEEKSTLFAVKVSDGDNATRAAVSEYALAFTKDDAEPKANLDFNVWVGNKGWKIANLHNRYSYSEEDHTMAAPAEYTWESTPAAKPIYEGALANTTLGDNRQDKCLNAAKNAVAEPIVLSTANAFTVQLNDETLLSATHFYIVLDKERALSSDDSEIKAWEDLYEKEITGINTVYDVKQNGGKATIGFKINDINDVLGFRVYAVNSNGTLVDPDGRAFYVRVGAVTDVVSAETSILADANLSVGENKSAKVDIAAQMKEKYAEAKGTITTTELTTDKVYVDAYPGGYDNAFDVHFEMTDGTVKTIAYFNGKDLKELAKIKNVYTTRSTESRLKATDYVDDQVYNGTISFKNNKGIAIATLNVSMKKVVPTTLPAGTGWKEEQLQADGKTYKCYVLPNAWAPVTATSASMKTNEMFNIDEEISNATKYTFYFMTNDAKVNRKVDTYGNSILVLHKNATTGNNEFEMIDDATPYDVTVAYNYGKVSSKTPNAEIVVDNESDGWKAIYSNVYGKSYNFEWINSDVKKQADLVKYGVEFSFYSPSTTKIMLDEAIKGISSYYAIYNSTLKLAKGLKIIKDKCSFETVSTGKKSEYFEIKWDDNTNRPAGLKAIKTDSNINQNVPSVLKITVLDCFGNERVIEMNMTVIPNV